jgi:hypothetical protein
MPFSVGLLSRAGSFIVAARKSWLGRRTLIFNDVRWTLCFEMLRGCIGEREKERKREKESEREREREKERERERKREKERER